LAAKSYGAVDSEIGSETGPLPIHKSAAKKCVAADF
jgi:hypothetical protein